jgi:hypothetical protein
VNDLQTYQTCVAWIDELNLDLQRMHEWAAASGLKLSPEKSQIIMISRCRVDFPLLTLLIGFNVIKVVVKVNNFGFELNKRLTVAVHF